MNHAGTQSVSTDRLILRAFTSQDVEPAYRNWCNDAEVSHFLTWQPHSNEDETRSIIESWIHSYCDPASYQWAIELRDIEEPVGSISVVSIDETVGAMEIGYCLGKRWWHDGLMTEALSAVVSYLFAHTDVNRICAKHDVRNPRSGHVMKACGLSFEGTLRQAALCNVGLSDVSVYSILRSEWEDGRQFMR
ncbi:MAG: GNAT family N-acetyltransferase [Atopobiaceae bacterium]|nr:GNAT family N-acetyltransferase [Atopobiaceae bacterium]MBR1830379.1 GNAT family N-acetyltransferase [Atopobiaceae bacterium]